MPGFNWDSSDSSPTEIHESNTERKLIREYQKTTNLSKRSQAFHTKTRIKSVTAPDREENRASCEFQGQELPENR